MRERGAASNIAPGPMVNAIDPEAPRKARRSRRRNVEVVDGSVRYPSNFAGLRLIASESRRLAPARVHALDRLHAAESARPRRRFRGEQ